MELACPKNLMSFSFFLIEENAHVDMPCWSLKSSAGSAITPTLQRKGTLFDIYNQESSMPVIIVCNEAAWNIVLCP